MNNFDLYGWYVGNIGEDRSAPVAPTNLSTSSTVGELRSNWTGSAWAEVAYSAPVVTDNSAQIKAAKWEEIKAYRDNLIENGGFKVGEHWYHSNVLSRTQYIALVMMGASIPAGTLWKTMENGYVEMTQTLANQVFASAALTDKLRFEKAAWHKEQMEASIDPESYDFTTGWPEYYQG